MPRRGPVPLSRRISIFPPDLLEATLARNWVAPAEPKLTFLYITQSPWSSEPMTPLVVTPCWPARLVALMVGRVVVVGVGAGPVKPVVLKVIESTLATKPVEPFLSNLSRRTWLPADSATP